MENFLTILKQLSFDDLEKWAGKRIVDRGRSYRKRVEGIRRTREGDLVAWVSGTEEYATLVRLDPGDQHGWYCTCPYEEGPCKHAVAVILAAAQQVKQGHEIPLLEDDDELSIILFGDPKGDLDGEEASASSPEVASGKGTRSGSSKMRKLLEGKSREELIDILVHLNKIYPGIEQFLREVEQMQTGQVGPLLRALRKEILRLSSEPAWRNHWNQEGSVPDYSHVLRQFQALFDAGHYDQLLDIGDMLWHEGTRQVEQSDDNGETAGALGECLELVLKAVARSSLPRPQQLLWVIERVLVDEFSLLENSEEVLNNAIFTASDWQEVAADLEIRLSALKIPKSANYTEVYRRKRLVNRLIDAYRRGGIEERIQPLLEHEVETCCNYDQLVEHLLQAGERELARQWCVRGFEKTAREAPGLAARLQKWLRTMAAEEKRYALVAAYRAQDFFDHPSTNAFKDLRKAMDKVGDWPRVRELVLAFLETGRRPDLPSKKGESGDWPLPEPEVSFPVEKRRGVRFPKSETLIEIAILEKRLDDVVRLYETMKKSGPPSWIIGETVAKAVSQSHPNVSLAIWREVVDRLIAEVKPRAYQDAAGFLRQMRKVYEATNRQEEWQALVAELRQTHRAKRRLLEVLDSLCGVTRKLVD